MHISLTGLIETKSVVAMTFRISGASKTTEFLIGPWEFNYTVQYIAQCGHWNSITGEEYQSDLQEN
jgi:hypothetical protein